MSSSDREDSIYGLALEKLEELLESDEDEVRLKAIELCLKYLKKEGFEFGNVIDIDKENTNGESDS
jgi:hypothetical protein